MLFNIKKLFNVKMLKSYSLDFIPLIKTINNLKIALKENVMAN